MDSQIIGLLVITAFLLISHTEAGTYCCKRCSDYKLVIAGRCPPPSKVYGCKPVCHEDYDCSRGKVCCPNLCNSKSCTEPAPYGGSEHDKYNEIKGGTGVYCGNVKCSPYEKCVKDPRTGRLRCKRA